MTERIRLHVTEEMVDQVIQARVGGRFGTMQAAVRADLTAALRVIERDLNDPNQLLPEREQGSYRHDGRSVELVRD